MPSNIFISSSSVYLEIVIKSDPLSAAAAAGSTASGRSPKVLGRSGPPKPPRNGSPRSPSTRALANQLVQCM